MPLPKTPLIAAILRFAGKLRFKTLFLITGGLFLLDLVIPDFIPLADELFLGLLTLLFASWKDKSRNDVETSEVDTTVIEGEVVNDKKEA